MKQIIYGNPEKVTYTTSLTREKRRQYDQERVERLRTWGFKRKDMK